MAKVKIQTREQRQEAGKALREKCPRLSHGKVVLGRGANRDIVALIKASNEGRLENLIPIRHGRMLQSPFAFFRGTAALQAHDLDRTPASGIDVQACGDCHLMNFGGFATPERNLIFDINDFDETLRAPFEWDVKRLAASFVVAARWRGFKTGQARDAAVQAASSYRESMRQRAGVGVLEGWYSRITMDDVLALAGKEADAIRRVREANDRSARANPRGRLPQAHVAGPRSAANHRPATAALPSQRAARDDRRHDRSLLQALPRNAAGGAPLPVRPFQARRPRR